jgi:hypothetical protein
MAERILTAGELPMVALGPLPIIQPIMMDSTAYTVFPLALALVVILSAARGMVDTIGMATTQLPMAVW